MITSRGCAVLCGVLRLAPERKDTSFVHQHRLYRPWQKDAGYLRTCALGLANDLSVGPGFSSRSKSAYEQASESYPRSNRRGFDSRNKCTHAGGQTVPVAKRSPLTSLPFLHVIEHESLDRPGRKAGPQTRGSLIPTDRRRPCKSW
jgi:hypothetical protein